MLFPILQNKFQNKKSMKQKVFSVIAAALMTIFIGAQAQKVHTIGDSTMAPRPPFHAGGQCIYNSFLMK